ncbi:MAG TPA: DUF3147 family protein [Candidatus Sulfotelmatobacter sp.]|jgi:hypothetical protein
MKVPKVRIDVSALREIKWYEYALRFLFGGAITVGAGLIAKRWGPELGGLFLAFPAIFPASATLVEKKEKEKKAKAGIDGTNRGRTLAGIDAAGAALGSIGLIAFALTVWIFLGDSPAWLVLFGATFAWALVGGVLWYLRKTKYGLRLLRARNR